MESNQATSVVSNSSSSGSSSTKTSPPFHSEIANFVKTNADTKPNNNTISSRSSSSSSSSSSDEEGFVSGEEEFEMASDKPVMAGPDGETVENLSGGENIGQPDWGSSEITMPDCSMPMASAAVDDDEIEKGRKIRAFQGEDVAKDVVTGGESGVVDGKGSSSPGEDGETDSSIPTDVMESKAIGVNGFVRKPEIFGESTSGENLNLNKIVEEGGQGLPQDGPSEVLAGSNGDKVAKTSKLDDGVSSAVEERSVQEEVAVEEAKLEVVKAEEEKSSMALNSEEAVTAVEAKGSSEVVEESLVCSHVSNQLEEEIVESVNSKLVAAEGVQLTPAGSSDVEAIHVNMSVPEVAVVGGIKVNKDSEMKEQEITAVGSAGMVNGSDRTSHDVEKTDVSELVGVDVSLDKYVQTSNINSVGLGKSEPFEERDADSKAKQNEGVVKISEDGVELMSSKDEAGPDRNGVQAVDILDECKLSSPPHEAKNLELDGAYAKAEGDESREGFSGESHSPGSTKPSSIQNSEAELEDEGEVKNHIDEEGDTGDLVSDGETDGMIFGSSEAAKQFIEELERGAGGNSHSGAESSRDQSQRIDGQIVTDSDEEVDTDEEGGGTELFDSAALAAVLKAATAGSDGGNITITSQDGSRLFSIERPAGLGSSFRSSKPAARPNRSSLFTPGPTTEGESETSLSEEEKKKLEKLQLIRVKFLRLVQRLGVSPDESVAAQVLYRLALIAGRQNNQTFSLDAAKRMAGQLEAEGKDDLDFSLNILLLGKSGVGKSATVNSIFGEEKSLINAFERATATVKEISGMVDGIKIKIFDTPGLKSSEMEQAFNRRILTLIKKLTKKSPPDIVIYMDRLDTQTRDLNDLPLLKTITSSLGPSIWRNAIVTLTHAASAPPDGPSGSPLSYDVFVTQRSHVVQQSIGHAVGDLRMMSPSLMNPVSLVENHRLCRKNREGQKVLPNGQTWRPQLMLLCYSMKILSETNSLSKPQDPFDHRKLFGFRARSPPLPYMLSSMLQTRTHPKLPSDQGIENADSDIDLVDLSDSDQEEEEDEYDQLPPFKPLRKAQIAKLSKEQRKAYFEEYDYRVKLLQKKQWREELRRMREMKKKGKDATANDYSYMGEDADQENEGAAAPVSTPLPDMVLPPSFDSDSPAYRYRFLEPTSQFLARPVLDTHGWDHDCGYDGVNLEQSLAIMNKFPTAVTIQITKDKKDFSIHLDSAVSAKHGENGSTMAGFDIQTIGKQLAYIVRGETKFKNLKKNKTGAGINVTFLGENVVPGFKIEDQIAWGKQWALVGSAGTVRSQNDAAYGANFELQRQELDYPIGQVQSTYGLSLIKWRGEWALGFNTVAQFSLGRSSKVAVRAGINNKLSGQVSARTSSSEHLPIALAGIIPIVSAIYKRIWPAVGGENYSIY